MLLGGLLCSSMTTGCRTDKTLDTASEEPHESDEVPLIQDALDCALNNEYRLPASTVSTSSDFHRVTLDAPDAVCNDGTPAVIFIRSAATNSDRWVFHLQGGGSCAEHDCAERWCENMNLMSSMNAPEAVTEEGIFSVRNDNVFADANYVFVPYCSSDNHAGTSGEMVISADDTHEEFRIHFQGHAIVQAAAAAIENGVTSDDGVETLLPLTAENQILLTGTSAGCTGVAHQADRLAIRWAGLEVSTQTLCDAAFSPFLEDFDNAITQELASILEEGQEETFYTRMRTQELLLDDSCVETEQENPSRCNTASHVLTNHITESRLFIFQDNNDSLFINRFLEALNEEPTTENKNLLKMVIGPASRRSLARAADGGTDISVYGRTCGYHVGLTADDRFYDHSIFTSDGALTYRDALVQWALGETVVAIDSEDNPSYCGE